MNDGAVSRRSPIPTHITTGGLIMTHDQIAIITLLAIEAVTLYALWLTHQSGEWWRKAWLRDSAELLDWKRNAVQRNPKTGRYIKKDKR
jgi:hypothetical protein